MEFKNIFELIPKKLDKEFIEILVQNKNIKIERIISKGHISPCSGWYNQEDNEWVIVLKGEAIIAFEHGDDIHLSVGDYVNIEAHTKHKVKWTNPEIETIWLAVHF